MSPDAVELGDDGLIGVLLKKPSGMSLCEEKFPRAGAAGYGDMPQGALSCRVPGRQRASGLAPLVSAAPRRIRREMGLYSVALTAPCRAMVALCESSVLNQSATANPPCLEHGHLRR